MENKYKEAISAHRPDHGIAVDASIIGGNPGGQMEMRGVLVATKEELFREQLGEGTNNIAEFLALVEGLRISRYSVVWSDSRTAMAWVKYRKCNTKYEMDEKLSLRVFFAKEWLEEVGYTSEVRFWDNKLFGENPSDFGRK